MSKSFEDLNAWHASIRLAKIIYTLTKKLPREEMFGLTSQMRRAAVSVSSNLAEGSIKDSDKEFIKFIGISLGSLSELKSQLILTKELEFITANDLQQILLSINEVGKLLGGLKRYLCNKNVKQQTTNH